MAVTSQQSQAPGGVQAWARRLRERAAAEPEMLLAHAMILPTLVQFILTSGDLPAWRSLGTILALAGLLVINLLPSPDGGRVERETPQVWAYLVISAALFLAATWLGDVPDLISLVLFLVIGQGTWGLRLPKAILFAAALSTGFLTPIVMALGWAEALSALTSLSGGILFTMGFVLLAVRYREQTDRAEALLAQLREANAALEAAREREKELAAAEERVRLARDIHDGLGHHLTVLNVQLQAAEKLLGRDTERAARAVTVSREVAQAALDEVRHSVAALRRSPLDGRTLDEALGLLVREFDARAGMAAAFEVRGAPRPLPPAAGMTLYRAAQEGLTNARKHGAATRVAVALRYGDSDARLTVEDDGVGTASAAPGGGFGLAALRERAEQLGGSLRAGPRAEGGFTLELTVPAGTQGGGQA